MELQDLAESTGDCTHTEAAKMALGALVQLHYQDVVQMDAP